MRSPKNRVCAERKPKTFHIWDTQSSRTIMEIVISYYQIRPIYGSEVSKRSHFWGTCSWGRGRGTDFTRTLLICIHSKTKTFHIWDTQSSLRLRRLSCLSAVAFAIRLALLRFTGTVKGFASSFETLSVPYLFRRMGITETKKKNYLAENNSTPDLMGNKATDYNLFVWP